MAEAQSNPEEKKGFLKNDRLLVCSMFGFYGICILGLIAATFWWLDQRRQAISANATSTAHALATQEANVTATAIARRTEQDRYEYIERFDRVTGRWFVGTYDMRLADAKISIRHGVYIWDIMDPKGNSQATEFYRGNKIKDFNVYMDSKFIESSNIGVVCAGLFFRKPSVDWRNGAYVFIICNDSHFDVSYYGESGWQPITRSGYESTIQNSDWNRVEVGARGDRFTFTINNTDVFDMTDERLKEGSLGIYVQVEKGNSAVVWFDNFGFQSH